MCEPARPSPPPPLAYNLPGPLAARSRAKFTDPVPSSEAHAARRSGNTQRACTCRTNFSFVYDEGVEIMSAGTKCSYVGGVSAGKLCDHSFCMVVKLAPFARHLYEAALANKKGFVIKEKTGHNGLPFKYVEVQMWNVEWTLF